MSVRVESPHGCFNVATEEDARIAKLALRKASEAGQKALSQCLAMTVKPGPSFPIVEHTEPPDPLGIKL